MWPKSIVALFVGCLVSISIMLNLNYVLPFEVQQKLLIGIVIAFPLWATAASLVYAANSAKRGLVNLSTFLTVSMLVNIYYFMS